MYQDSLKPVAKINAHKFYYERTDLCKINTMAKMLPQDWAQYFCFSLQTLYFSLTTAVISRKFPTHVHVPFVNYFIVLENNK